MSNAPTDRKIQNSEFRIQNSFAGDVLHVRPHAGRSACADDMATRLDSTGLSIDTCHDVYRGLARACTGRKIQNPESRIQNSSAVQQAGFGKSLRALVLCMDVLGAAELEFFTIVARSLPQLPIYIYGETAVGSRLARAVESGAVSEATDDLIDQLAGADSCMQEIDTALDDRLNLAAATDRKIQNSEFRIQNSSAIEQAGSASADAIEPPGEDEEQPVQVPWLNRPDRPVRGRPVDRVPSRKESEPDVAKKETGKTGLLTGKAGLPDGPLRGAHEPLLTNEELQALLGDDLADSHGSTSPNPFDDGGRS